MTDELFDVRERVVVITGGLGQLGQQFARALAWRGARVAILDSAIQAFEIVTDARSQATILHVPGDVTHRESLESALAQVTAHWGTPFALINNAALDSPPNAPPSENGPFESYPEASWDRVMEVNVKGVFQCCQVFGGAMADAGRGSIINIASIYGLVSPDQRLYEYRRMQGEPFYKPAAYAVSKSALLNLTRYLATYWAPRSVRVNTVTFGGVYRNQAPEFLQGYSARVPLGRMAREDEYNGAIVFLVSDASSYMTGSNMILDGGWTAW